MPPRRPRLDGAPRSERPLVRRGGRSRPDPTKCPDELRRQGSDSLAAQSSSAHAARHPVAPFLRHEQRGADGIGRNLVVTPPDPQNFTARRAATRDWCVEAWLPDYKSLGYSREEADRLVRVARVLWDRYTALGLTIDSLDPPPTAVRPFEVLVQAVWQLGMLELFSDSAVRS
jgi:hypothetical protein